jgi:GGDEF domain-containing protein
MSYTNTMSVAVHSPPLSALPGAMFRSASGFVLPIGVFALAYGLAPFAQHLPRSFAGLPLWGPLWALVLAGTLALIFNRSRVVYAVLCLVLAYAVHHAGALYPIDGFTGRLVFAGLCLFVPANLIALAMMRERGVFNFYGVRRLGAILLQIALVAWALAYQRNDIAQWAYVPVLSALPLSPTHIPHAALALMTAGIVVTVIRAVADGSALDAGLAGAMACFVMACQTVEVPNHFPLFIGASALALVAAVLQDTFRLAFRDELTGLPSRRALNERLLTLGSRYTIAMVDVDYFKRFNDAHGHELGDHVLRMVAAKLRAVGGGGRAYRYGGEEFALVFPGRRIPQVWPHLEALRRQIGVHPVVLRGPGAALGERGGPLRTQMSRHAVHVTVSLGVAERNERHATPAAVLRAADKALYRAKDKGRDRVSL